MLTKTFSDLLKIVKNVWIFIETIVFNPFSDVLWYNEHMYVSMEGRCAWT